MTRRKQEGEGSCTKAEGSGKKLAEDFLARLNRSCEQHGIELLDRVYAERPKLYFNALVKLAMLDIEPSRLNDFDPRHNRDEVLRRLGSHEGQDSQDR
jgi:hypothetical protein